MVEFCKRLTESNQFQNFITAVIIFAGILVGAETYPSFAERYHSVLHILDQIILWTFVAEIVLKTLAQGRRPWRYFYDGWNVFDFIIVAGAFLPFAAQYATVLRLLRLLRVLKLVRALPRLQMLVGALLKSIPSMAYVSILLTMLFYVYAVAAVFMWGDNDPVHFGNLQISFVSLFRAVTLEDWTDLMYIQMYGCENYGYDGMMDQCVASTATPVGGAIFFISFVLIGTMIFLNLFIGVILSGMDEAQQDASDLAAEDRAEKTGAMRPLTEELESLHQQLEALQSQLSRVTRFASKNETAKEILVPGDAPAAEAAE
ncbi:MAG: ion transporter [Myxococcota bacterium]